MNQFAHWQYEILHPASSEPEPFCLPPCCGLGCGGIVIARRHLAMTTMTDRSVSAAAGCPLSCHGVSKVDVKCVGDNEVRLPDTFASKLSLWKGRNILKDCDIAGVFTGPGYIPCPHRYSLHNIGRIAHKATASGERVACSKGTNDACFLTRCHTEAMVSRNFELPCSYSSHCRTHKAINPPISFDSGFPENRISNFPSSSRPTVRGDNARGECQVCRKDAIASS